MVIHCRGRGSSRRGVSLDDPCWWLFGRFSIQHLELVAAPLWDKSLRLDVQVSVSLHEKRKTEKEKESHLTLSLLYPWFHPFSTIFPYFYCLLLFASAICDIFSIRTVFPFTQAQKKAWWSSTVVLLVLSLPVWCIGAFRVRMSYTFSWRLLLILDHRFRRTIPEYKDGTHSRWHIHQTLTQHVHASIIFMGFLVGVRWTLKL